MKFDSDVRNIQKEAVVAVSKATELFLTYLSSKAFQIASRKKRKTIKDSDLIEVIQSQDLLKFLQTDFPKQTAVIASSATRKEIVQEEPDNNPTNTSNSTIEVTSSEAPPAESSSTSTTTTKNGTVRKYFKPKITEFE